MQGALKNMELAKWSRKKKSIPQRSEGRYNSEYVQPSVKHGGGWVMVWGGISASCVGYLLKMNGIMKAKMIVRLSSKSSKCILGIFFFKHKMGHYKSRCPQSPDISIIEAVWESP